MIWSLEKPKPRKRGDLRRTEAEALAWLERAATDLVKQAGWHSYYQKRYPRINELRAPLLALRLARRKPHSQYSPQEKP